VGIGKRAVSSAHQQSPESEQPNSDPQPEQTTRRTGFCCKGGSLGIVMIRAEALASF
jgi:hypothetical protein